MRVEILTPETKLFHGEAQAVLLPGIAGKLEILENHAPMIAALQKGNLEITRNGKKSIIEIQDGFVECIQNKLSILVAGGKINE